MTVHRYSEQELLAAIGGFEDHYPDFASIYADEMPRCCKVDEVAARHGWGPATEAWETYASYRWLLGEDA